MRGAVCGGRDVYAFVCVSNVAASDVVLQRQTCHSIYGLVIASELFRVNTIAKDLVFFVIIC